MFMETKISSTAKSDLPSARALLSSIEQTGHALFGLNSDEQLDQLEDLPTVFGATDDELQMLESFLKNSDDVDLNCLQDELSLEEELECAKNIDEVTQMISSMDEENSRSDVGAHMKGRKCKFRGVSQTAGKKWGAKYGKYGRIPGASACATPSIAARAYDCWLKENKPDKCRRFLNYCTDPCCGKFRNPLNLELSAEEEAADPVCMCNDRENLEKERRDKEARRKREKRRQQKRRRKDEDGRTSLSPDSSLSPTSSQSCLSPVVLPTEPLGACATSSTVPQFAEVLSQQPQLVPTPPLKFARYSSPPPCLAVACPLVVRPRQALSYGQLKDLLLASAAVAGA